MIGPKQITRIACWNVRTLYQAGKTKQLTDEMKRYNIDICGVSEVRWTGSGKVNLESGETIIYVGCEEEHRSGVAIVLSRKAAKALTEWNPVSDRIIHAKLASKYGKLEITQCYAPTNDAQEEDKEEFYDRLEQILSKVPKHSMNIVMGDFNAKVGNDNSNNKREMGRHGLGEMNNNGERLLQTCSEHDLVITGTLFQHKNIHKATWVSPDKKTKNQIDHIMINGKYKKSITDTKVSRGADIASDHYMVISKVKLKLQRTDKKTKLERERFNTKRLQQGVYKEKFQLQIRNRFQVLGESKDINDAWDNFKNSYLESAREVIGVIKTKTKEWMSEDTRKKVEQRREIKAKINSTKSEAVLNKLNAEYKKKDVDIKKSCRRDKREATNTLIEEAEEAAKRGEQGTVYKITKQICGKNRKTQSVIRDKDGNALTNENKIRSRWHEHFSEVLNRDPPKEEAEIEPGEENSRIETGPVDTHEIKNAIKKLKNNKAPGIDNITSELLKADIDTTAQWLKKLYDEIWEKEETPSEWAKGILVTLPKKGDLSKCQNWRGITLMSTPCKILGSILIERIKKELDGKLRPEQAGFRSGRRTSDQIFILKNVIEQCQEWQAPLYMNFVDFEKAFDSVHRETLWKIAAHYGVPKKLINIMKQLYKNTEVSVVNGDIQTDWIRIISGVKQGCNMSGFLFILVLDWVMNKCAEGQNTGIRWNFMNRLEDLEFADDIALISSKFDDIQKKTNKLAEAASKTGLKINIGKTNTMRINSKVKTNIRINNEELEDVDQFTYLGAQLNKEQGTKDEISTRITKARSAFIALQNVWKSNIYSSNTKIRIYKSNVRTVLLYGAECWKMTKNDTQKCETFQNKCLRRILKVFWPRKITNIELREKANIAPIEESVRKKRWTYIGHILRRETSDNRRVALQWAPEGKRKKGRPKETWRRMVEKERNNMGWKSWEAAAKEAADRKRWKELCSALCPTRGEEDR